MRIGPHSVRGPNMAVDVVDNVIVVVHGPVAPTDEEWTAYLAVIERQGITRTAYLIEAGAGEPNQEQRRQRDELLAGHGALPIAILSDIARIRIAVMPLTWVRGFRLDEVSFALGYLRVPVGRRSAVRDKLDELRAYIREAR